MMIINLSVKEKLSENKIIEAASIFLSVNQITLTIKLLISLAEYELAFYLMDISNNKLYEDFIYVNLLFIFNNVIIKIICNLLVHVKIKR